MRSFNKVIIIIIIINGISVFDGQFLLLEQCLLCFLEGYNSHRSQHAVCEDEINLGALESLKSSDVERLDCLVSQGFFALDALPAIGQIMDELEK